MTFLNFFSSYFEGFFFLNLIIPELPKISLYPAMPLTVRTGEHVYIYCNATGEEPIHISWHNEDRRPLPA